MSSTLNIPRLVGLKILAVDNDLVLGEIHIHINETAVVYCLFEERARQYISLYGKMTELF